MGEGGLGYKLSTRPARASYGKTLSQKTTNSSQVPVPGKLQKDPRSVCGVCAGALLAAMGEGSEPWLISSCKSSSTRFYSIFLSGS